MDTMQILKKAWGLVWRYRALWLFGALLAMSVSNTLWLGFDWDSDEGGVQNRIILSDSSIINFPGQGVTIDLRSPGTPSVRIEGWEPGWYRDLSEIANRNDVRALLISIGVMLLSSVLLSILFRYTSEAALIRMVDENERTGEMVRVGRGLRLGWSRVAGKLFLIDALITLPVVLVFGLLFFVAFSPLLLLGLENIAEKPFSIVAVSLLTFVGFSLFSILTLAVYIVLLITQPVMHRACAVDGLGVGASIRQGFSLLMSRSDRVLMTWLVWITMRLLWTIVLIPLVIILSPILLLTMLAGIVIGAVPALLAAGVASLFVNTVFAWIIGALFGLPLFFLVAISPIIFLSGLVSVFMSSFWTLSYREFRPLAIIAPQPADKSEPAGLRVAPAA